MDPERWQEIDKLLSEALKREPSQREDFLEQACAGDEELHKEVRVLLEAHDRAGSFMERPALEATASSSPPLLIGRHVGPFEILSLLGRGGMGEVYRVRDTRLDRINALKILPPEVATDPDRLRRFIREAKAASGLNHPNIATIHEIGESDGIHWIGMELVEGQTLAQQIKDRPLNQEEILDIGIQAAEALAEAHNKGVIHRDIKPANLMLTPKGMVKILDFGLAKRERRESPPTDADATETHTVPGLVMGTARYMSPEQVLGQPVDHRTDIFSLGVVLYEMAVGQPPFRGESSSAILDAIVHQTPTWPPRVHMTIPEELRRIIQKCLEKFCEIRYQSATHLCADLRRLRHGMDLPEAAGGATEKPTSRRKSAKWIAAGIVVVSLVVAGVLWYANRRVPQAPVEVLNAVPLTTYPGIEDEPTLSPDGSQVAFTWAGENGENTDIWVKVIGTEPPLRLTSNPARDFSPAWSPDGRWIAFSREMPGGKVAVFLISPIGGQERILTETLLPSMWVRSPFLAWTRDSHSLVIAARDMMGKETNLFLFSLETREKRKLTAGAVDSLPAVSPDGSRLVFCRWASWANSDLYLTEISDELAQPTEPKRLTFEYARSVWAAWSSGGRALSYSVRKGTEANLWRTDLTGSGRPQRLVTSGQFCSNPVVSCQGDRLVYVQRTGRSNLWRMETPSPHQQAKPPEKFITTSRFNAAPRFSPDGKRIAFISDSSGTYQIWVCNSDGSNPVQVTSLAEGFWAWYFPWSPDSSQLTFQWHNEGRREVYVVNAGGGRPQRLTTTSGEYPRGSGNPSWSRDGQWILFDREEAGIWKIPVGGGDPVQLIKNAWCPVEAPDGKSLYYAIGEPEVMRIVRVQKEGGESQEVLDAVDDSESYEFIGNEIYFISRRDPASHYSIRCLDTTTGDIRSIATFDHQIYSLTVSPDRRWILWAQGEYDSDLMLVENFR